MSHVSWLTHSPAGNELHQYTAKLLTLESLLGSAVVQAFQFPVSI
jgi:hypothetical protein